MKNYIVFCLLLFVSAISVAQTEEEIKDEAAAYFDNEKYVEATPLYLRLISLQPRNPKYNYRYGTCLLYNSNQKNKALRYLKYAASTKNISPNVHFFLGKAYQLDYQFNNAIQSYTTYKSKAGSKAMYFDRAERNIAMCRNGNRLLASVTDIIVEKKTEIPKDEFFRIYDLSSIGGAFIVASDFQSRQDKKRGHTPIIHFPPGAQQIYFSSYGNDDNKDIFTVHRKGNGSWGEATKLQGEINTPYDEDFPYMHPNGEDIYFSSKGHNSMGGFDIFKGKMDAVNGVSYVENMDFAISSPDNDMLYVVDEANENAFFASSRQSENGKLFVYKVKVSRVPLQLAIVKGKFESLVDSKLKKANIKVIDQRNEKEIGDFSTQEDGSYMIVFPKGGEYRFEVTIGNKSEVYPVEVSIPFQEELKPLKQNLVHEQTENGEVVKVSNLFDEDMENVQIVIAQALKERSKLDVNVDEFDLDAITKEREALSNIGLSDLTMKETAKLLTNKLKNGNSSTEKIEQGADAVSMELITEIQKKDEVINELLEKAENTNSTMEKRSVLQQAEEEIGKREHLENKLEEVESFAKNIENETTHSTNENTEKIVKEIQTAVDEGENEKATQLIADNQSALKELVKNDNLSKKEQLFEEQQQLASEITNLEKKNDALEQDVSALKTEKISLEEEYTDAKKRDKEDVQAEVDAVNSQIELFENQLAKTQASTREKKKEETKVASQIALLTEIENNTNSPISKEQVANAKQAIASQSSTELKEKVAALSTSTDDTSKDGTSSVSEDTTPSVSEEVPPTASDIINELEENYTSNTTAIENNEEFSTTEKMELLQKEDRDLVQKLKTEQRILQEQQKNEEKNENIGSRLEAVEELLELKDATIQERAQILEGEARNMGADELSEKSENLKEKLVRNYSKKQEKLKKPEDNEALVALEEELQSEVTERLTEISEKLKTHPDDIELLQEKFIAENILQESEATVASVTEELRDKSPSEDNNAYMNSIRSIGLKDNADVLSKVADSPKKLETQEEQLIAYQSTLKKELSEQKNDEKRSLLQEELQVTSEQLEKVQAKLKDSATQNVLTAQSNSPKEQLEEELTKPSTNQSRKKEIEKELAEIDEKNAATENANLETKTKKQAIILQNAPNNNEDETIEQEVAFAKEKVEDLDDNIAKAKSETEKNFWLKEKEKIQNQAIQEVQSKEIQNRLRAVEQEGVELNSKNSLEKQQRQFSIEIGSINQQIKQKKEELENAKRREKPIIEKEIEVLEERLNSRRAKLMDIERKLENMQPSNPIVKKEEALATELTYNEERQIAATEEYENYAIEAKEAMEVEKEIRTLKNQLEEEQRQLKSAIKSEVLQGENKTDTIEEKKENIRSMSEDMQELEEKRTKEKQDVQELEPISMEKRQKFKNLVVRGVNPLKKVAVATAVFSLPINGLSIDKINKTPRREAIPVDIEQPSGLVYRVQVGAFSKAIPDSLFAEFKPVSGEKIKGTNITRYMAGFFNNSQTVANARAKIRNLGYSDAFVVAYCDGERISYSKARIMEQSRECVPKKMEEMRLEIAQKTTQNAGIENTSKAIKKVDEYTYHRALGAAKASPIEAHEGLFFTVQVGVYNRPVSSAVLHNISPLMTLRLPNGQIRYSSGMFSNIDAARAKRKNVLEQGISDAYVVAYYKGERINWKKGMQLLEENGSTILEEYQEQSKEIEDVTISDTKEKVVFTQIKEDNLRAIEKDKRIQIATEKTFDEFPRDVLNRYNNKGSFYFDSSDRKVKSVMYDSEARLPRVHNFKEDIDTLYLEKSDSSFVNGSELLVKTESFALPGDFGDWLLRFGKLRTIKQGENSIEIRIFGLNDEEIDRVSKEINAFGLKIIEN